MNVRTISLVILIGISCILPGFSVNPFMTLTLQTTEVTAVPVNHGSLFLEDTCIAPCWFSLVPGVSTSSDVEMFLQRHRNLFYGYSAQDIPTNQFDPYTHLLINGTYDIYFEHFVRDDVGSQINSVIKIEEKV